MGECRRCLSISHANDRYSYISSRPPIQVLQEIRKEHPELLDKMEIYVDGGIRRGTDVLKALSLGARAVGLGRPFLYAQSAYGAEGVVRAYESA